MIQQHTKGRLEITKLIMLILAVTALVLIIVFIARFGIPQYVDNLFPDFLKEDTGSVDSAAIAEAGGEFKQGGYLRFDDGTLSGDLYYRYEHDIGREGWKWSFDAVEWTAVNFLDRVSDGKSLSRSGLHFEFVLSLDGMTCRNGLRALVKRSAHRIKYYTFTPTVVAITSSGEFEVPEVNEEVYTRFCGSA
jgi:hypothetical protein